MIIESLNIQNIKKSSEAILNTLDSEINSAIAIDLDLSGAQLLAFCHLQNKKKIKIHLTESSEELLSKSGFSSSINDGYLIFK